MVPLVLVTGAGGLVGKHIMRSLANVPSIRLLGVVRGDATGSGWSPVKTDLASAVAYDELVQLVPAVIVHTAAVLPSSFDDAAAALANTSIDKNVVRIAESSGAGVLFLSSSSVYANAPLPWTEDLQLGPLPAYAASKLETETELRRLGRYAALRISSPYSAVDYTRRSVLYNFVRQAVVNQPLRVSDIHRTQDFIHAQDIGNAVRLALLHMLSGTSPALSGAYNIVSAAPISMLGLAEMIVNLCGSGQVVPVQSSGEGVPYRAVLSREKARLDLSWEPEVAIETGIAQLIRRMRGGHEDWLVV